MRARGIVIVYYGDGKGKTTAALGLSLRAVGRGMRVLFLQFMKGEPGEGKGVVWSTGEREFIKRMHQRGMLGKKERRRDSLGTLEIRATGEGFVGILGDSEPFLVHKAAALRGLSEARSAVRSGSYDVVVLDEILRAVQEKLLTATQVRSLIVHKPKKVHVVLTGHTCPPSIIQSADLVSEIKKVKHPFDKGILACYGIDY